MFDTRFLILCLLTICGNAVEAITGFGSTIIAVTLGAHFYDIDKLVVIMVPVNICLSTFIVIRHRQHIDYKELFSGILPLAGTGLIVGLVVFQLANTNILKKAFGIFVFIFSIVELIKVIIRNNGTGTPEKQLSLPSRLFWLLSGGLMQGIYASGGPMVVYYASRKIPDKRVFRSTLSALWLILVSVMFASHIASGKASIDTLKTSFSLLPPLVVGIFLGEYIHSRIPEKAFRIFVYIILTIAGASLIAG